MTKEKKLKQLSMTKTYLQTVIRCITDMENGMTEYDACHKYQIRQKDFQDLLIKNVPKETKTMSVKNSAISPEMKLYYDIMGRRKLIVLPTEIQKNIPIALQTLTEREQQIIQDNYWNQKSIEEIAKIYSISSETVHKSLQKALRKLRQPYPLHLIENGLKFVNLMQQIKDNQNLNMTNIDPDVLQTIPIETLQLSTRITNCLKRNGVFTLHHICSKTEKEIKSMQAMGVKSFEELTTILTKLHLSFAQK